MLNRDQLKELQEKITYCKQCRLHTTRNNAVPSEGNLESELMIIGQAPGKEEDRQGRMFLGPSGRVLNQLFDDLGLKLEDFYMTNLLKCLLPKSRKPRKDEINICTRLYLLREIELVNPKVLITLGYHATKSLLENYRLPIPNRHHFPELFGSLLVADNRRLLPLRHPATVVHESANYDKLLKNYKKIHVVSKTCKWYHVCPIKTFYDQGKLPKKWIDKYCKGDWTSCVRYNLEEKYIDHPDNLLPDGTIDNNL